MAGKKNGSSKGSKKVTKKTAPKAVKAAPPSPAPVVEGKTKEAMEAYFRPLVRGMLMQGFSELKLGSADPKGRKHAFRAAVKELTSYMLELKFPEASIGRNAVKGVYAGLGIHPLGFKVSAGKVKPSHLKVVDGLLAKGPAATLGEGPYENDGGDEEEGCGECKSCENDEPCQEG